MHHSARNKQQFIGEKATALFFSVGDYDDWDSDYATLLKEDLPIVTASLCERKMNLTLDPGQMCARAEEDRYHCQVELCKMTSSSQIWWVSGMWVNINSSF